MALTYTPAPNLGQPPPSFSLPAVDGKTYEISQFRNGKPLVIMFICNHCPYVQAIEDRLVELGHDCQKLDVSVIAICSNDPNNYPDDSFENLKKRSQEKNYSFTYLHDADQKVAKLFGAVCTPDYFVYDSGWKLAYRGRLDDSWKDASKVTRRELFTAVQRLSRGERLLEPQTPSMGCSIKWSKA
jgi:peroxiredoxin